ncbi:MAG: ABC transporter ATP-binding protein [Candidatus Omnitrophica bacterium]|nr:ABC transporter ATP-binding protein [Candidatus Omnitrophota bacterium]MDD5553451.1 ABC transporter ATP-binding protein [Candidatus Omnitrophota bacterium]
MGDVVIRAENVSKKYCKTLRHSMMYGVADIGRNLLGKSSRPGKLRKNEFWAVDNVSFEVKRGETLGLIGPNGSGKTTLLKMLNGIFWPDKGKIMVNGRVGALIAVGAGFHPLLTGRENIYINGAILGMKKREIDKKFDSIVEFADIGDFLESPVKHYSSGMFVRLGFAVAVHCEPEILLVDEVLAVGDVNFQHKCLRRMADMMESCAVIMVSHNAQVIRFICDNALFLNKGQMKFLGPAAEGIDEYIDFMVQKALPEHDKMKLNASYSPKVKIEEVRFCDAGGNQIRDVNSGEALNIDCRVKVTEPIPRAILGVAFYLDAHERSFICYSSQIGRYFDLSAGTHIFRTRIPELKLKKGVYHLAFIVAEKNELASHTWDYPAYILVKNPKPQYGFYSMDFSFELGKPAVS